MEKIAHDLLVTSDPEVVDCVLGDGSALLDLKTYVYYSLNEVGAFVWDALEQPVRFDQLVGEVAAEFDAPRDRIAADLQRLVTQLDAAGLVRCAQPA